ncbi:GMC family oxidoreductase [Myxococcota bacterium]|nr:GMC family oxidoreductase [Myxococcota bacterium]
MTLHALDDVRRGFSATADVIVVGSGAGGAVTAANLARAGLKVVVVEAGPEVKATDMTVDAPRFLARYYWEGGLRVIGGTAQIPSMQGRCLGGGTVMNSAIMLPLPAWVRALWATEAGLDFVKEPSFDEHYARVFAATHVTPTPLAVLGRRNEIIRDALAAAGIGGGPLPRAVEDCHGCGSCITGCAGGHKQSTDRSYLPVAREHGAEIFTCAVVERVLTSGARAVGVTGVVVDPFTHERLSPFTVRAPRVVLAAGPVQTPVALLDSGIHVRHTVGATFFAHMGCGIVGIMDEIVDPWIGATQGWGAISSEIPGLKFESLWAPPSLIMVRWGDVGERFLAKLGDVKHATVLALVYRGRVRGRVTSRGGQPHARLWIPDDEAHVLFRGMKLGADALLAAGARFVHTGTPGTKEEMRAPADTEALLSKQLRARDLAMTANHIFGSCRMTATDEGPVDLDGRVRGVDGLWITDASIFPSPSAVNPQATIMALADRISRRIGELSRAV